MLSGLNFTVIENLARVMNLLVVAIYPLGLQRQHDAQENSLAVAVRRID